MSTHAPPLHGERLELGEAETMIERPRSSHRRAASISIEKPSSGLGELLTYVGRVREFSRRDWLLYIGWVGLMAGLCAVTGIVVGIGHAIGAPMPGEAYLIPVGAFIFTVSIAVDTIGHRTIYREEISKNESLVHGITILCGIGSCVLLSMAYTYPSTLWIPAMVLTVLSGLYSLVDEAFHWRRYVRAYADRVEMWSHVGILTGHLTMMIAWWVWFFEGYRGVAEILAAIAP